MESSNFRKIREIESVDFNFSSQKNKMKGIENVQNGNDIVYYDGVFTGLDNFRLDRKKYPNGVDFGDGTRLLVRKTMKVISFGSNNFHVYPSPVPELLKTDPGYGFLVRDISDSYFEKARKKTVMHIADFKNGLLFQVVVFDFGSAKIDFNPLENEENVILIDKRAKQKSLFYTTGNGQGKFLKMNEANKPFPINQLTIFCLSHLTDKILISH